MSDASVRARLVYTALLEDVSGRMNPSGDSNAGALVRILDHVAFHPNNYYESLFVIRDMARIVGGVLVDVLGGDRALDYLLELLVLVDTAGILDDAESESQL